MNKTTVKAEKIMNHPYDHVELGFDDLLKMSYKEIVDITVNCSHTENIEKAHLVLKVLRNSFFAGYNKGVKEKGKGKTKKAGK